MTVTLKYCDSCNFPVAFCQCEREGKKPTTVSERPAPPMPVLTEANPLATQVGGSHYTDMAIQPMEFALKNGLDFATANAIKYLVRRKGDEVKRAEDLRKAIHCIQLLADHEGVKL